MLYSICISRAGHLGQIYALDLTEYLVKEKEYVPWITALSSVAYIGEMLLGRDGYKYYEVSVIIPYIYRFSVNKNNLQWKHRHRNNV